MADHSLSHFCVSKEAFIQTTKTTDLEYKIHRIKNLLVIYQSYLLNLLESPLPINRDETEGLLFFIEAIYEIASKD